MLQFQFAYESCVYANNIVPQKKRTDEMISMIELEHVGDDLSMRWMDVVEELLVVTNYY